MLSDEELWVASGEPQGSCVCREMITWPGGHRAEGVLQKPPGEPEALTHPQSPAEAGLSRGQRGGGTVAPTPAGRSIHFPAVKPTG